MSAKPLDLLAESEAIRMAGADAVGCEAEGVVVVLGDDATVIIADPLDARGVSGVQSRGHFHLHGPFVADVGTRFFPYPPTSPRWRWGQRDDPRPIHLLTRLPEGCLYLGIGRPRSGDFDGELLYEADLAIEPALPSTALDRVRPASEPGPLPGLEWLADVRNNPRSALDRFVRDWIPETAQDLGDIAAAEGEIPPPLVDYYRLARHRPPLLGVQNYIDPPERWQKCSDRLVSFAHENQGDFRWLFDPRQEDPEVWLDDLADEPLREHEPLSGFLLQFALFETMMNMPYGTYLRNTDERTAARLTDRWSPLPWAPWQWPNYSQRLFVAPGLIATVSQDAHSGQTIMVRAVHRSLIEGLEDLLRENASTEDSAEQGDSDHCEGTPAARWEAIDREIFAGRKIQAIRLIRAEFGGGIHEGLDLLTQRYEGLRRARPAAFATGPDTYWDGFRS